MLKNTRSINALSTRLETVRSPLRATAGGEGRIELNVGDRTRAGLDYEDPNERNTKAHLALAVNELLSARKLKQREAAELLSIPQSKVSALKNYHLENFSVERLLEFLIALNQEIEITIRPRYANGIGQISVWRDYS